MARTSIVEIFSVDYEDEFLHSPSTKGRKQELLREFFLQNEISSYRDITVGVIYDFRNHISEGDFESTKKRFYGSSVEEFLYEAASFYEKDIIAELSKDMIDDSVTRKAVMFLMAMNVRTQRSITYEIREAYEQYLNKVGNKKISEYLKRFDDLKQNAIKKMSVYGQVNMIPKYQNIKYYLPYHPVYEIADSFRYMNVRYKVFDFTKDVSRKLKEQVWTVLFTELPKFKQGDDKKQSEMNMRVRHITLIEPLFLLYKFCIENGIDNISKMSREQKELFFLFLNENGINRNRNVIIYKAIKCLFYQSSYEEKFESDVWFLHDLVKAQDSRFNLANSYQTISFDDLAEGENKELIKKFIRNRLVLTVKSISSILSKVSLLKSLFYYLEEKGQSITQVNNDIIAAFIHRIDDKEPGTVNRFLATVLEFLSYLVRYGFIESYDFDIRLFWRKTYEKHLDRSVEQSIISILLTNLSKFPEVERLMYLHLWMTGLRINEICGLKVKDYFIAKDIPWLRVWQNKAKKQKDIPITDKLYELMMDYISEKGYESNDYVFPATDGGPYRTSTFRKNMKNAIKENALPVGDYQFKAHDYRHNIATETYRLTKDIQLTREFMGHNSERMTNKYIDYVDSM